MYDEELKIEEKNKKEYEDAIKFYGKFEEEIFKIKGEMNDKIADQETDEYKRKLYQWNKEVENRRKNYNELLKEAQAYYDKISLMINENPLLASEAERIAALIQYIQKLQKELDFVDKQTKPKEKPKGIQEGISDGMKESRKELANEYEGWKNMTKNTASSMRDSFSDMFFDSMNRELKSLTDYWQLFSRAVRREIANIVAAWVTSGIYGKKEGGGLPGLIMKGIGLVAGTQTSGTGEVVFGADDMPTVHGGGWIKRMHGGGPNLKSNESLRILKEHEYVIRDSSARSLGGGNLDYMNQTGRMPSSGGVVKNYNSYSIFAMDSESIDQALRRGGAKAIAEISLSNYARESERRGPSARRF